MSIHYSKAGQPGVNTVRYEVPRDLMNEIALGKRLEARRSMAHFVHSLRQRVLRGEKTVKGFYEYSSKIANKLYGGACYHWIRTTLVKAGKIHFSGSWWAGSEKDCNKVRCQGVRLDDAVVGGAWETIGFPAKQPRKRTRLPQECVARESTPQKTPFLKIPLLKNLAGLEVDPSFRDDPTVRAADFNYLQDLASGNASYRVCSTGRITHPLGCMSKIHRHYVTFEGEQLTTIDTYACFPSCIGWLLNNEGAIGGLLPKCHLLSEVPVPERDHWLGLIADRTFYEFFVELTGKPREWVKRNISMLLSAGVHNRGFTMNPIKPFVDEVFPTISRWIKAIKDGGSSAAFFQGLEAKLILATICPALHSEGLFWIPLHDAVFALPSQVGQVMDVMNAVASGVWFVGGFTVGGLVA